MNVIDITYTILHKDGGTISFNYKSETPQEVGLLYGIMNVITRYVNDKSIISVTFSSDDFDTITYNIEDLLKEYNLFYTIYDKTFGRYTKLPIINFCAEVKPHMSEIYGIYVFDKINETHDFEGLIYQEMIQYNGKVGAIVALRHDDDIVKFLLTHDKKDYINIL